MHMTVTPRVKPYLPGGFPEAAVPGGIFTGAPPRDQTPLTEPHVCAVGLPPVSLLQLLPAAIGLSKPILTHTKLHAGRGWLRWALVTGP